MTVASATTKATQATSSATQATMSATQATIATQSSTTATFSKYVSQQRYKRQTVTMIATQTRSLATQRNHTAMPAAMTATTGTC